MTREPREASSTAESREIESTLRLLRRAVIIGLIVAAAYFVFVVVDSIPLETSER